MSEYIFLGKIPTSPAHRQQLLSEYEKSHHLTTHSGVSSIVNNFATFLQSKKGFLQQDILLNKSYDFALPDVLFSCKADIIIHLSNRPLVFVKCVIASLESWERYACAFCRTAIEGYIIPFAIITNNDKALFINAISGELISEQLLDIPDRTILQNMANDNVVKTLPEERIIKEKRILYAFDAIRCSPDFCT